MNVDAELKKFSEHMQDVADGVKCPRHANTNALFHAMRRLAIEYMHTEKAIIALQRIESTGPKPMPSTAKNGEPPATTGA